MALFPERGSAKPPEVVTPPEQVEIPEHIEKVTGVRAVPAQFTKQVQDDQGRPVISTPQNQVITITLPQDQAVLATQAKATTDDSLTWFAAFWLRIFKKALHFGWKIVAGGNS